MPTTHTLSVAEQIDEYIRQHSMWKNKILEALKTGKSEHTPADIAVDNKCAMGKWLYGGDQGLESHPSYEEVRKLHADFHKAASKTLADALAGRREQAVEDLENGPFRDASSALILAMSRWKRALG